MIKNYAILICQKTQRAKEQKLDDILVQVEDDPICPTISLLQDDCEIEISFAHWQEIRDVADVMIKQHKEDQHETGNIQQTQPVTH